MTLRRGCWAAALTAAALLAVSGCGHSGRAALSTVAHPVDPPPVAHRHTHHHARPSRTPTPRSRAEHRRTPGRVLSDADTASFARLAAGLGGQEGLAISRLGRDPQVQQLGTLRRAVAWSTSKVPIAMAVIAAGAEQRELSDLRAAITASDNAAATRLWASLGSPATAAQAADAQLRAAGDERTVIQSRTVRPPFTPFGQTDWSLADQVRFTAGMACVAAGAEVLGLMNQVVPSERWGLGAAGVSAQFKGGWGPGSRPGASGGYLDRQMGVLTIHGKPLAVTVAALPADGSHDSGVRNLTAIAQWVVAHADVSGISASPRC